MSVHYKFNSEVGSHSTVTFDGIHISVAELKKAIMAQRTKTDKSTEFDLQITNAQSKEGM